MCRVVIVQHGEKISAPGDPGLTPAGIDQADRTADALRTLGSPSALLSSPLRRARETAEPLARIFDLEIGIDERIAERMNWEGETSFGAFVEQWEKASSDRDYQPTIGDSSRAAGSRFLEALVDHCPSADQGPLLVVAHGGVTVDLLRTVLGDEVIVGRWPTLIDDGLPPCGLTQLSRTAHGFVVDSVADVSHL